MLKRQEEAMKEVKRKSGTSAGTFNQSGGTSSASEGTSHASEDSRRPSKCKIGSGSGDHVVPVTLPKTWQASSPFMPPRFYAPGSGKGKGPGRKKKEEPKPWPARAHVGRYEIQQALIDDVRERNKNTTDGEHLLSTFNIILILFYYNFIHISFLRMSKSTLILTVYYLTARKWIEIPKIMSCMSTTLLPLCTIF